MSITIGNYTFDGPYNNTTNIKDQSGVYAILDHINGQYSIVDVGESEQVKTRVDTHDRASCWNQIKKGTLAVSALYVNKPQRMQIEQEIRGKYTIPCGER